MKRTMQAFFQMVFSFAVGATILGYSHCAEAQPARLKPGKGDDLRALYATALDVTEGKSVAEASCVRCHGVDGISTTKGVPHLAGQRAAYLHLELRAYQSGARGEKAMDGVVKFLSDDALLKVAAYYASLDPPATNCSERREARARQARPGPGRQGRRHGLRRVPRRGWRQQDSRHAEPRFV